MVAGPTIRRQAAALELGTRVFFMCSLALAPGFRLGGWGRGTHVCLFRGREKKAFSCGRLSNGPRLSRDICMYDCHARGYP